jgi:DNA-binding transcriptional LysR family regulator
MDLDVRRLRVLREVALRGTIASAAASLGFTPSAISQQLSALERETGTALLERAGRGLRLTDAGRLLVERTEPVLTALEQAAGALESARASVAGEVRLSSIASVAAPVVIPMVVQLAAEYPELDVTVHDFEVADAMRELRLGGLDIVVAHEYEHARIPADPDIVRVELFSEEMLVAAPTGRFRGPVALRELAGETWAAEPAPSSCGRAVREACRAAGFEPDVRFNSTEFGVVLTAVAAGAVSLLPQLAVVGVPSGVDVLAVTDVHTRRMVFAAHRQGSASRPSVRLVLDRLRAGAAALSDTLVAS